MNNQKNINALYVLAVLTILFSACSGPDKEAVVQTENRQTVEVVRPQNRSFVAEVLIAGTTKPNQIVTLYAMESGILTQINKDIGDKVVKGETIAILENPELLQRQISLEAELQAKKSIYERLNLVYEKTPALTNIQMVENAKAEYFSAKAGLEAVASRIGFLRIRAPFTGIITKRFIDQGSLLQSGLSEDNPQAIVEVQQTNPIRLTLPVPEADALAVKVGMDVQVDFPEMGGKVFKAKVSRTAGALDPLSKTMQVEIDLENANGEIITGMYAKVLMKLESRKGILSLPMISKISYKNEDYVLAVEKGVVKRIPLKIGLSDGNFFEILNAEITAETEVIIKGKGLVNEGQQVEPKLTTAL